MNKYFDLIANEFAAQAAQIKQFVRSHGPSIGSAHEVILRSFLKRYLPKWVSVGHGFIMDRTGSLSRECDIIVYNSTFYSPLYQIEDFVVLASESVISVIEVKTVLNRRMLLGSLDNLITVKRISPKIETALIVFNPPSLKAISAHIEAYDFAHVEKDHVPDWIFGLSKYVLGKVDFVSEVDKTKGVAFMSSEGKSVGSVFEYFYQRLYLTIEMSINKSIKKGIDSAWIIGLSKDGKDSFSSTGRFGYSTTLELLSNHQLAAKIHVFSDLPDQDAEQVSKLSERID